VRRRERREKERKKKKLFQETLNHYGTGRKKEIEGMS